MIPKTIIAEKLAFTQSAQIEYHHPSNSGKVLFALYWDKYNERAILESNTMKHAWVYPDMTVRDLVCSHFQVDTDIRFFDERDTNVDRLVSQIRQCQFDITE